MRTFAQKQKPASDSTAAALTASNSRLGSNDRRSPRFGLPLFTHDFRRIGIHPDARATIQPKLRVNIPGDTYEQEADRIAEHVMRMPERYLQPMQRSARNEQARYGYVQTQRVQSDSTGEMVAPPIVNAALRSSAQPLDPSTQRFMEARFGHDFSRVRVHTGSLATDATEAINARAFTVGNHLVFSAGQYAPATYAGKALIAHELTHTIQQMSIGHPVAQERVQRYTPEERRAMAEGRVTGQASDLAMANQRHFQPGDIVFRLGSTALGLLMGEPVTHGGIYVGGGLIHDVVGFGNRHVPVTHFFNPALGEAANTSTYRVVRFRGPHRDLIVARLVANIGRRDFRLPTDPVPFNLFSSADDYRTATCLEYAHAQFLYAIRQLSVDPTVPEADRRSLRSTYFTGSAAEPNALIRPQEQRLIGNMVDPTSSGMSGGSPFGSQPPRTPGAMTQEAALVAAATALASDVDPGRFSNRSESEYRQHWAGGSGIGGAILNLLMGPTHDEVLLRTFTYRSFVDSRQFFEDVTGR
jgi:hypothetical protein